MKYSIVVLMVDILEFDQYLGYYPLGPTEANPIDTRLKWLDLSTHITLRLLNKMLPSGFGISSMTSESRFSEDWKEVQKQDLALIDSMSGNLGNSKEVDIEKVKEWITFTPINLKKSAPIHSTGIELTKYSLDKSYLLEELLKKSYSTDLDIIGEMELSFLIFTIAQVFDGLEQWKTLLGLFCHTNELMTAKPLLFAAFLNSLANQIKQFPSDFFDTELTDQSFIEESLENLIDNVRNYAGVELQRGLTLLIDIVEERFGSNFGNLRELEEGEDAPQVV